MITVPSALAMGSAGDPSRVAFPATADMLGAYLLIHCQQHLLRCMPQRVPRRALSVPRVSCLCCPLRLMLSMCDDVPACCMDVMPCRLIALVLQFLPYTRSHAC